MKKVFPFMLLLATVFAFSACSSDDDETNKQPNLTQHNYILYAGETTELKGKSLRNLKWSGDKFVAQIDENGILHANKIGVANIHSDDISAGFEGSVDVTVKPKVTKYSEPLLYWHGLGEWIKYTDGYINIYPSDSNMPTADIWDIRYEFISYYVKECGMPWTVYKQDATKIIFKTDKSASPYVTYLFDDDNEVMGIGVYIDPLQCYDLPKFFDERYLVYDVDINKYEANFVHGVGYRGESKIDYIGRMGYVSSLGLVMIAYAPINETRSGKCPVFDILANIKL